ncbi:MAG: PocR ligand-binding domain-containing protein [Chthoniobacteraceae bacterium]
MRDLYHVPVGAPPPRRLFRRLLVPGGMLLGLMAAFFVGRRTKPLGRPSEKEAPREPVLEKRRVPLDLPVKGTAGLRFQDLFDLGEIQRIQDAFSTATGVASIITDANGRPLTRPSNFCTLCQLIRATPKGRQNCYRSDAALGRTHPEGPIIAPCLSGGLFDGGASICVGKEHIANWLIGQVRDESISDEQLMGYAREIGADQARYREALAEVPHMSTKRFKQVGEVLYLIAGQLSKLALRNVQQGRVIDQLEETQAELRGAKETAEAASHAKDQFLGVLSHELRTPLTAVLATVAMLREESDLSAQSREDMELIGRNVALEARLIDDLLDVTRIGKGKMEIDLSVTDIHSWLRSTVEICESDAVAKKQTISLQLKAVHHHVLGDGARLQQAFWNLIKNALKFTPEGGRIEVRTFNDGERIKVEVADNGIGIEPRDIPRIFEAFEQLGQKRGSGGLGLGLSIAKAIVELHHGTLSCLSQGHNRGCTFTVDLAWVPAPESISEAVSRPAVSSTEAKGVRVLLVEDHRDTLLVLSRMLRKWGYTVTPADTLAAALEHARNTSFDILVSDLGLPDGSGLELMRQLRIPGIALSGYGTENDIQASREAGFDEHLVKPVGLEALHKALQKEEERLSQPV